MRRFLQVNKRLLFQGAAVAVFLLAITSSCTDVDNTMGGDFIPDNQQMTMQVDTFTGIDAYLSMHDSFPTLNIATGLVGQTTSPVFGHTEALFACQFISSTIQNSVNNGFGANPRADSLYLEMFFSGTPEGDTSKLQTINVYMLNERLRRDANYYAGTDIESLADMSSPLFSFDFKGSRESLKLNISANAGDLIADILDTAGGIYRNSDKWYERMPGFLFKADASSPEDASIISISLDSMLMTLYGQHTRNSGLDTTFWVDMEFSPGTYYPNASASSYKHDYTGSDVGAVLSSINDTMSTSAPVELGYVQGMGGVVTYLRFQDRFIADLKSKIVPPYRTMVINKALLEIGLDDPTPANVLSSLNRLGLYYDYNSLTAIDDYNYQAEEEGVTIAFDGYLNRTRKTYPMDISSFVQDLIVLEHPNKVMEVGPQSHEWLRASGSVLNVSNNPANPTPMKVTVTYTLIR